MRLGNSSELFPPAFRAQVERLAARWARLVSTAGEGSRQNAGFTARNEFAGHGLYSPGDDPRMIDWSAFGRLGRLYVKQFERERERRVMLAPDLSASMSFGLPEKRLAALRLTAASAALALRSGAAVDVLLPGGIEHCDNVARMSALYAKLASAGNAPSPFLPWVARQLVSPGIRARNVIVFSDLLEEHDSLKSLVPLAGTGRRLALVGIVAPRDAQAMGLARLTDAETSETLDLDLDNEARQLYWQALDEHLTEWARICSAHRIAHEIVSSDAPMEEVFLRALPAAGVM